MSTCRLLLLARHVVRSSLFTHLVFQDLPNCAHKILRFIECSRTNENSWNSWTIVNEEKITLNQSAKVNVLKIHEKRLEYWTRNTLVSRSIPRTCNDLYEVTNKRLSLWTWCKRIQLRTRSRTRTKIFGLEHRFSALFSICDSTEFTFLIYHLKNDISIIWIKDDNSGKIMKSIPRKINNFHTDFRYGE